MGAPKNPVFWATSWIPYWVPILSLVSALALAFTFGEHETAIFATWSVVGVSLCLTAVPRKVTVGAEGLRIAWLGLTRTVRYGDVRRAAPVEDQDVHITLRSGIELRLHPPPFGATASRAAVLERLWSTLSVGAEERLSDGERALLARSGRRPREWARALGDLARAGAQYRSGVSLERLFGIAANPAIDAEHRGAAAAAIAGTLDDETRARLEEIATTTVDEAVRTALTRIAHATDEAGVADALADLGKTR